MADQIQLFNPKGVAAPLGLYSHVARVAAGELIFLAGQVAVDSDGAIVGIDDFEAQFRQVFENLRVLLQSVGADFRHVVKFTTYLLDAEYIKPLMRVRAELWPQVFGAGAYPPNTLVIIDRLVREEFLLEIEAVARAPG
jgi:enamine deaminase RidA (YjgF/YER057c/UK114 family)